MYLTINKSLIPYKGKGSKIVKRSFTQKSPFVDFTDKPFLSDNIHFCQINIPKINIPETSYGFTNDFFTYFKGFSNSFPDLLYPFKGLLNVSYIKKIEPLISDFYLDAMITKFNSFSVPQLVFYNNFSFIPHSFAFQGFFFDSIVFLLHNRLINTLLLCATVYFIQSLPTFLSYDNKCSPLIYVIE